MAEENPLLARLLTVFGTPDRTDDVAGFLAEYRDLLKGFGPNTLRVAGNHIIRNGGKFWPTPKSCVEACIDAQEDEAGKAAAERGNRPDPKMPWETAREDGMKWAKDYVRTTDLGRQAQSEGWARQLELYAASYARGAFQLGRTPKPMQSWKPDHEIIWTYRQPFVLSERHRAERSMEA